MVQPILHDRGTFVTRSLLFSLVSFEIPSFPVVQEPFGPDHCWPGRPDPDDQGIVRAEQVRLLQDRQGGGTGIRRRAQVRIV